MSPILIMSAAELIAPTRVTQPSPIRRLYAIENTLAELVGRPVDFNEIQMSASTLAELLTWMNSEMGETCVLVRRVEAFSVIAT